MSSILFVMATMLQTLIYLSFILNIFLSTYFSFTQSFSTLERWPWMLGSNPSLSGLQALKIGSKVF